MIKNVNLVIIGIILIMGCSSQNFETVNTGNKFLASATYSFDVDVLWVIDNSYETMEIHQNRIARKMKAFYNGLRRNNANFRVAATTMDMSLSGARGDLVGSTPIVKKNTPNAVFKLEQLLKRGGQGANAERGLLAMKTALTKEKNKGRSAQFLRDQALLVVVFVTDDKDFSTGTVDDYKNFLNTLKGQNTQNQQKWIVNYIGVIDLQDPECTTYGSYSALGEDYLELANSSGGVVESICSTDFTSYIDQINVRLKSVLSRYHLDSQPILDSLTVYINGVLIREDNVNGWSYDEEKNIITLNGSAKPNPNDDVEIKYEIKEV